MSNEALSERERQVLEHLERAQSLDVTLKEYAEAYSLEVKDLYTGKSQLVKKGVLAGRAAGEEKSGFVAVRLAPSSSSGTACRLSHPSGWILECASLPEAAWLRALLAVDAAT
jgi:hypothetical protein